MSDVVQGTSGEKSGKPEYRAEYLGCKKCYTRLWIVQGVLLAGKLVVSCGKSRLDGSSFIMLSTSAPHLTDSIISVTAFDVSLEG
jgi:hypothetical protein